MQLSAIWIRVHSLLTIWTGRTQTDHRSVTDGVAAEGDTEPERRLQHRRSPQITDTVIFKMI